jgi:hypothetical protein
VRVLDHEQVPDLVRGFFEFNPVASRNNNSIRLLTTGCVQSPVQSPFSALRHLKRMPVRVSPTTPLQGLMNLGPANIASVNHQKKRT